jgi:uncharacterized protein (TIGR02466 family)
MTLFATEVYRAPVVAPGAPLEALLAEALAIAADDRAGQKWSEKHGYGGYTSYASLNDLPTRAPAFAALAKALEPHIGRFCQQLEFDLGRRRLVLDSLWINVLEPGGVHPGHIHPQSVLSGTVYLAVPRGAAGLKLEDPRLGLMMAAPPRKPKAARQAFVTVPAEPGWVTVWESWLRHEVPMNQGEEARISVSFNYGWR